MPPFDIPRRLTGPSSVHLFGTDQFGRDILSRAIYGAQVSLTVALTGTALGTGFGVLIGAIRRLRRRMDRGAVHADHGHHPGVPRRSCSRSRLRHC